MRPVTGPTFRIKPYAHPKYKFVVRAKLAGKWKRSYFRSEAEAAAYAGKQNISLEKQVKRQRSGRVRSDGHTNGAGNWHELEKSNRRSPVSSQALSRKAVVVLGMHRSGTSTLCGALDVLGVNFGKHLMPANEANPKGYWEPLEIVSVHDDLLRALGSHWDDDRALPVDWLEREVTKKTQSRLLAILQRDFGQTVLLGLKDPRMSRLMPLWFPLFQKLAIDPRSVLVIRHPWEVAQSLAKRDGLDHRKSYLLWLQHTLEAESATRGHKRAIVDYGELLKEPVTVLRRLRSELELEVVLPAPSTVQKSLRKFLQSSLRHQNETRREDEDSNAPPPLVLEAYKTIREAIRTKENSKPMSRAQLARSIEFFQARLAASRAPFIHRYLGGAWKMHLPFAYNLVRELKPKVLVELGVYKGESYFAFCQSVEENGTVTRCYGIDTWRGDVHAGIYGPEIGNEVAAYNSRYSRFSHLMAMTFKEAAFQFADRSVDLLHIDGAHRYEDVKDDFETWLPKLSRNGIVLLHDVTAREKGFGVDKLWREIATPRASFLFEFGNGLGVWRRTPVSKRDPPFLRRLFLADSKEKRAISNEYATMASAVELSASPQPEKAEEHAPSIRLETFAARGSAPCPEYSSNIEVAPGRWCRLKIDLPWGLGDGSAPLRFDPADRPGLIDVAAVSLRSSATGEILWRADKRGGLEDLAIHGTALRLPHPQLLRLLSYADDPQVYLPHLTDDVFQEPLTLEILLRFDAGLESIERAITAWKEAAIPSVPSPSPGVLASAAPLIVIFADQGNGYSGEVSLAAPVQMDVSQTIRFEHLEKFHTNPRARLRIDPIDRPAFLILSSIRIIRDRDDFVLYSAESASDFEKIDVSSGILKHQEGDNLFLVTTDSDPQIYLPILDNLGTASYRLEITLEPQSAARRVTLRHRRTLEERAQLAPKLEAAQSQLEKLQAASGEWEKTFSELQASLDQARTETIQHQAQAELDREQIASLETELRSLHRPLEQARTESAQFSSQLETERAQNEKRVCNIEQQKNVAESELEETRRALHKSRDELFKLDQNVKNVVEVCGLTRPGLQDSGSTAAVLIQSLFGEIRLIRKRKSLWKACRLLRSTLSRERTQDIPSNPKITAEVLKEKLEEIQRTLKSKKTPPTIALNALAELIVLQNRVHQELASLSVGSLLRSPQETITAPFVALKQGDGETRALVDSILADIDRIHNPSRWWKLAKGFGVLRFAQPGVPRTAADRRAIARELKAAVGKISKALSFATTAPEDAAIEITRLLELRRKTRKIVHSVNLSALLSFASHRVFDLDYYRIWKLRRSHATERSQRPLDTVLARGGIDFEGTLENPGDEVTNEHGLLLVTGWLYLRTKKMAALSARLNGGEEVRLAHSLPRADVARHLPQFPSVRDSGFEGYVPIEMGFSGRSRLEVEAVLTDGTRMRCFQREVIVKLPDPPRRREPPQELSEEDRYARWIRTNQLTPYLLKRMTRDSSRIGQIGPQISIVVPTFNTPAPYLEALIKSVRGQVYPNWQLCLADDASTEPHVRSILEKAAAADSRVEFSIRPANGHIVKASNSALDLAKGDYVGLLDHDDLLTPDALLHVAEAIVSERALDVLYTDEDKLSPEGKRYDPIFKGSFSPEMSLTHNYIQHFTVIRKTLLQEVGGFREGFEGAQDLDLYLRVLEKTTPERVRHLPFVCYHWRSHPESTASNGGQKKYVFDSAGKSIAEALTRRCIRAVPFLPKWAKKANCCLYQLKWSPDLLKENPVTIVIPTKNRSDLLQKCLASLERTVGAASVNVIIVDDFSEEESTRSYLKQLSSRTRLPCRVIQPRSRSAEFNFSRLINEGVAAATTPLVLLLNNDTEALDAGWLEEMVGWMSIRGVGAVGAKLLYPDHTIQHAGVIVGSHGGLADHIFHRLPEDVIGFNFLTHAARNVSAVTGACILTSKAAFDEVRGFDQGTLGMEYNDVDFCLRLGRAGKRVVFTPQATLLHRNAQSRGKGWRPNEHLSFLRRYPGIKDPYYNENLDLNHMPVAVNPSHFMHRERVGKLKVLMISHNLNLEGAPKVLFDHAAYFASSGGYNVTMVSRKDGPLRGQVEEAGILVRIVEGVLPRPGENTLDYTGRLREIGTNLEAKSYDLVVCSTLTSFWGVVLAGLFNLPAIWHIHESTTLDQFFHFDPVPEGLVESCLASADRIVFQADATRKLFTRYEKGGNFKTISGAIDVGAIDRFREQHSQRSLKVKHGIDPDKIVVSLIGTTCPRKGQLIFVQAIELLQTTWPNDIAKICFVMLGARESPYLHFLRTQLETIRETDTRLIEERHDVFDFYRLTDIFVCASFQESFPRVILESMAFKLPIVTTDVFGIPEILEKNNEEALLVHAGDPLHMARCIKNLVRDPKAREELGAKAHAKVTRLFNSRTHLGRQLDLTKEVLARHG
ncbi:MAG: hypothetical protein DMF47_02920 [Verrucomicrobia bacterium]|nr:MAG: hypothetical protein DMF47_02920 [Verrucomicrobiota bacterium]